MKQPVARQETVVNLKLILKSTSIIALCVGLFKISLPYLFSLKIKFRSSKRNVIFILLHDYIGISESNFSFVKFDCL